MDRDSPGGGGGATRGEVCTILLENIPLFALSQHELIMYTYVTQGNVAAPISQVTRIAFQSKADHPRTEYTDTLFFSCDRDLYPMTLTLRYSEDVPAYQK